MSSRTKRTPEGLKLTRRVASAQSIREATARKLELITIAVLALAALHRCRRDECCGAGSPVDRGTAVRKPDE
jgi:hypothetical protein